MTSLLLFSKKHNSLVLAYFDNSKYIIEYGSGVHKCLLSLSDYLTIIRDYDYIGTL